MTTSTYSLPDLLHKWARGDITLEQAIGHLLQHLLALANRQHLVKRHSRASFPAALTHVVTPLVAIYRLGRTARCEIVVSAR